MADKGNYYKRRSKEWLVGLGYSHVEYTEKLQRIAKKDGGIMYVKRDLFHSDGIAIGNDEVIFWNSVLSKANVASHVKNYLTIPWPACEHLKVWIIVWEKGAHEPEIIDLAEVEI